MKHSGSTIRLLTDAMGLDTEALARIMGVNPRTMSRWLSGAKSLPADVADQVITWEQAITTEVRGILEQITAATQADPDAVVLLPRYADRTLVPHSTDPQRIWAYSPLTYDRFVARIVQSAVERGIAVDVVTASRSMPGVFTITHP